MSTRTSGKRKIPEADDDDCGESGRRVASKASDDSEGWVDEYKCPITQELPVDPVMAEDGRCYEASAIEDWFSKNMCGEHIVKSPMTNQYIGTKLVQAVQIRNAIERLIDTGLIVGEPAQTWKEKVGDTAKMTQEMRKIWQEAQKGEKEAMTDVGFAYQEGTDGLPQDWAKAATWFRKATLQSEPHAVMSLGVLYINGTGVDQCWGRAFIELSRAATLGSEHAAISIGRRLSQGSGVMKRDMDAARFWFNLSKTCKNHDSCENYVKERDMWLTKHGTNYTHSCDQ
tara:strand:- start:1517 stop:2371 length:855 start_codon:yes stop_codon:yes gene_type:complete